MMQPVISETATTLAPHFAISLAALAVFGALTLCSLAFDLVLPLITAKRFGASGYGLWGSFIGMILGLILFPPLGALLGLMAGAVGGLMAGAWWMIGRRMKLEAEEQPRSDGEPQDQEGASTP